MNTTKTILITGGTGMIGRKLIPLLLNKGYTVHVLSRRMQNLGNAKVFLWNYEKRFIDSNAFENVTHIIHLAGEGIADKRWTDARKKQLIRSRVMSAQLLENYILKNKTSIQKFISASAIGYYGIKASNKVLNEDDSAGNDFMAHCCVKWEEAANDFAPICKVVKLRLAVILDKNNGFYPKMALPIKFGLGAAFGKGTQSLSWIHIDDVCSIFCKAVEDDAMIGVYNAVAPDFQDNKSYICECAKALNRPYFLPNIPAFMLKLIFGELSEALLYGQKVSSQKLIDTNFSFRFNNLEDALEDLIK